MDEERLHSSLIALRSEWMTHSRSPYYRERSEWVRGIIKGIDLSIARLGYNAPPPKSSGSWVIVLLALAVVGVLCWLALSMR